MKTTITTYRTMQHELLCQYNNPAEGNIIEKDLAILFLDLRDYTGLLQAQPAREVVHMVKKLFGFFSNVINSFGGRVIDRAGDSLYAVFGLKTSVQTAVVEAFNASKMLFDALAYFNTNFAVARFNKPIEIGIGLHAGNVIIEEMQNEQGAYLSVMGLPVNIAARLQAETRVLDNDFIVSEHAYGMLDGAQRNDQHFESRSVNVHGVNNKQSIRLAGSAYHNSKLLNDELSYLLAIAG
ncbi:adenylate/guanylate cyclase domain-containing protein [Mucilaginibacter pallidiroseus]|uniref:Adenylate/guanylate cyclase domain-containing protein n=1 Tax=Mucilaginibacter pallidiroseus TaxID=2599295 RepID=A0A563UJE2_9SPHI|nr:adenylate/guanylate cyclase domain-containing protein [Mucilaginibacter pallidiroseus]TWR31487.1 adenylate/guanylate cyclase domain-containing protein [Mucilaginibacter pallidiroseus]